MIPSNGREPASHWIDPRRSQHLRESLQTPSVGSWPGPPGPAVCTELNAAHCAAGRGQQGAALGPPRRDACFVWPRPFPYDTPPRPPSCLSLPRLLHGSRGDPWFKTGRGL